MREGSITAEEARTHPKRNIVTRALGIDPCGPGRLRHDHPLRRATASCSAPTACSTRSTTTASPPCCAGSADPGDAAAELVRLANEGGGRDNITVLVVDVVDDDGRAEAASRRPWRAAGAVDDLAGFGATGDDAADDADVAADRPRGRRRGAARRRTAHEAAAPPHLAGGASSLLLVVVVLGGGAGAIGCYARGTYFVGFDGDTRRRLPGQARRRAVVRPDASIERTDLHPRRRARPSCVDQLEDGVEFGDRAEAEAFPSVGHHHDHDHDDDHDLDDEHHHAVGVRHVRPPPPRDRPRPPAHRAGPHRARRRWSPPGPTPSPPSARPPRCRPTSCPFLGIVLGLLVTAHVATRRLAPGADGLLLPLAALLNGIGYVFIARLDEAAQDAGSLAGLQAVWTALGVGAYIATLLVVRRARDLPLRYTFLRWSAASGCCCCRSCRSSARPINGARIWVELGPVGFQPGEFAKIALAIFFAGYLVDNRELLGLSAFAPEVPRAGAARLGRVARGDVLPEGPRLVAAVLRPVRGAAVGGHRPRRLPRSSAAACSRAAPRSPTRSFDHVQDRVDDLAQPVGGTDGAGFQVVQSWFALAWGGVGGTGLGLGNPDRIPVVETDFIFAAIGEELGLLGTTAIIISFLLMIGAGLRIALRADEPFEKLLATGLTTLLGLQAFIIIGGVTRLLPLTGVTLPFVSYGGSSLLGNYVLLALLVRISDDGARRRRGAGPQLAPTGERRREARHEQADRQARHRPARLLPRPVRRW